MNALRCQHHIFCAQRIAKLLMQHQIQRPLIQCVTQHLALLDYQLHIHLRVLVGECRQQGRQLR
ncbi:hypothetical protein D3C79_1015190 [compost metagenome]